MPRTPSAGMGYLIPLVFLGRGPRTPDSTHSVCFFLLREAQLPQTLADRHWSVPGGSSGLLPSKLSLPAKLAYLCWPRCVMLWAWGSPSAGNHLPHLENKDLLLNGGSSTRPLCAFQGPVHFPLRPPEWLLISSGLFLHTSHSPQSLCHRLYSPFRRSGYVMSITRYNNDS